MSRTITCFARSTVSSTCPRFGRTEDDLLRQKNARLRGKIDEVVNNDPELRDLLEEIALKQGEDVQVRVRADLQERARATPSSAERARREHRHPKASTPAVRLA